MFIFLKRWLLYLFVPMGLVLLFFPLNTHRLEDRKKDFVFLEISETLVVKDRKIKYKRIRGTSDDKAMEALEKELQKMHKLFSKETATAINPYGYPILRLNDLVSYPNLQTEIENMLRNIAHYQYKNTHFKRLNRVSIEEWNSFSNTFLSDSYTFQYGNYIFRGKIKSDHALVEVEISQLKLVCKVMGVIFLLLGLLLLRGLYMPPSKGIQIGKRTTMIIWDVLIMVIAIFFTSAFFDGMLVHYFQTTLVWGDAEMELFMGIFWVILANPIMALFTTATAAQTVWITQKGIAVKSLFSQKSIAWSDVINMKVSEYYSIRKLHRFYAPRKLMKVLKIYGVDSTLRIMEPPLVSTKEEILDMLILYAPETLKKTIFDLSKEWLSVW